MTIDPKTDPSQTPSEPATTPSQPAEQPATRPEPSEPRDFKGDEHPREIK